RAGGEPVEDLGSDRAALLTPVGRFFRAGLAGDEQDQPRVHRLGLAEAHVEPTVGLLERVAVEIEHEVGRDRGAGELAFPRGIETAVGGERWCFSTVLSSRALCGAN